MYAKVFQQIYDSSIVEKPEVRFTFMDLLVLADPDGVVDMTHEVIARRTNRPVEVIRATIAELEAPDPHSRTPDANGARLTRLDAHRDWGWCIINFDKFHRLANESARRAKTRARVARYRKKARENPQCNAPVTHSNAPVTLKKHVDVDVDVDTDKEEEEEEALVDLTVDPPALMVPFASIVGQWNTTCGAAGLARVKTITDSRKAKMRTRWATPQFREAFAECLNKLTTSSFARGDSKSGWRATFDWLIDNDKNWAKVIEGHYDDPPPPPTIAERMAKIDAAKAAQAAGATT